MASAKDLARQRREQLFAERTFTVPLNGYEGVYEVRYRALSYEELRKIGLRNQKAGLSDAERELADAADSLINASVAFVDVSDGEPINLDARWSAATVRELFGVELPEGASARSAIRKVLPSLEVMLHFAAYDQQLSSVTEQVDEVVEGESEAA